ncbi:MAG: GNAT family N-acetyltransferase [Thermoplasmata archaeon]
MIRRGNIEDFDIVKKIEKKTFGKFAYLEDEIKEMIRSSYILLYNESAYIAFFFEGNSCHVESIAVLPNQKKKGIGSTLMKEMEKISKENGINRVILEVREKNYGAIKFYESIGYKKIGLIENYYIIPYRGSRNAFLMEKILDPLPSN